MSSGNTVEIIGNLTRDAELRYTPNGQPVASFGLAYNHRYQRNGEWQDESHFFDVTCWQKLAENVAESLVKGMRVVVSGRLQYRAWETTDGDKRSKVEIVADDVAVSLRWATVDAVTKNPKEFRGYDDGDGGGNGSRQPARAGGSRSAAPQAPVYNPEYGDEEPF